MNNSINCLDNTSSFPILEGKKIMLHSAFQSLFSTIRKRRLTIVNEHAMHNAMRKRIMATSCVAFGCAFSSVEIYLQLVAGVFLHLHAFILVYIWISRGLRYRYCRDLVKKSSSRSTRDPLLKENYMPRSAFSILYCRRVYDAGNFLN